ncbi:hypothetical protein XENOCAPTIV_002213 [Xenoophorus captivus]|uniref:AlkB homolog 7 n=1 Tax=Xenoophorus captivus TaxID=1517983 RepID=A0ABV0RYN6_9TELE
MKLLLTALKHTRKPAVYICHRFCSSACSSSRGPSSLQDEVIVGSSPELVQTVGSQVEVRPGFITQEEEAALLQELEPGLRKKRYEFDHWDDAIHGYRETERLRWAPVCEEILSRVRAVAFPQGGPLLGPVHVLDLDKAGYIKPHVDSVKVYLHPHCYDVFL